GAHDANSSGPATLTVSRPAPPVIPSSFSGSFTPLSMPLAPGSATFTDPAAAGPHVPTGSTALPSPPVASHGRPAPVMPKLLAGDSIVPVKASGRMVRDSAGSPTHGRRSVDYRLG